MVDWFGRWTEEKDYSQYPKEKWCDYDYMASWIREQGYEPRTEMENLIDTIFLYYESTEEVKENGYYAIDDKEALEKHIVSISDMTEYVRDSGGLKEFDF